VVRAFLAPPPPPDSVLSPKGSDRGDGEKSPEKETREIQTQTSMVSEKSAVSVASSKKSNGKAKSSSNRPFSVVNEEEDSANSSSSTGKTEDESQMPQVVVKERKTNI
jgi:hypothetical protein